MSKEPETMRVRCLSLRLFQRLQALSVACLGLALCLCFLEVKAEDSATVPANADAKALPAQTKALPAQMVESLKTTSSAILTNEEFNSWWQNFTGSLKQQANNQDIHPVALQPALVDPSASSTFQAQARWADYRLKAGDLLSIQVVGHPELSLSSHPIMPDGSISLPLIGKVPAMGQSADSLREVLTRQLAYYLKYPVVSVNLEKIAPQRMYVLGSVKKPGLQLLDGTASSLTAPSNLLNTVVDYHLSTALIKAGGLLADADLAHIKVFKPEQGIYSESNMIDLLAYGKLSNDLPLQGDEVVYIPRLGENEWNHPEILKLLASSNLGQETYPIRVYGYVTRPDVYQLSPSEMTLQSILAKAGIDIEKAQRHQIIVARTLSNRQLLAIPVDGGRKDTVLYPNDVVIVAHANWKQQIRSIFGAITTITTPAANVKYILNKNQLVTP